MIITAMMFQVLRYMCVLVIIRQSDGFIPVYPNTFNVAKDKPVVINQTPDGVGASCDQGTFVSPVTKEIIKCANTTCSTRTTTPEHRELLEKSIGTCGSRDTFNNSGTSLYFDGSSNCTRSVRPEYFLQEKTSLTFWMKHDVPSDKTSNVFTIEGAIRHVTFFIYNETFSLRWTLAKTNRTLTHSSWTVRRHKWTHISLLVTYTDVTVYINGQWKGLQPLEPFEGTALFNEPQTIYFGSSPKNASSLTPMLTRISSPPQSMFSTYTKVSPPTVPVMDTTQSHSSLGVSHVFTTDGTMSIPETSTPLYTTSSTEAAVPEISSPSSEKLQPTTYQILSSDLTLEQSSSFKEDSSFTAQTGLQQSTAVTSESLARSSQATIPTVSTESTVATLGKQSSSAVVGLSTFPLGVTATVTSHVDTMPIPDTSTPLYKTTSTETAVPETSSPSSEKLQPTTIQILSSGLQSSWFNEDSSFTTQTGMQQSTAVTSETLAKSTQATIHTVSAESQGGDSNSLHTGYTTSISLFTMFSMPDDDMVSGMTSPTSIEDHQSSLVLSSKSSDESYDLLTTSVPYGIPPSSLEMSHAIESSVVLPAITSSSSGISNITPGPSHWTVAGTSVDVSLSPSSASASIDLSSTPVTLMATSNHVIEASSLSPSSTYGSHITSNGEAQLMSTIASSVTPSTSNRIAPSSTIVLPEDVSASVTSTLSSINVESSPTTGVNNPLVTSTPSHLHVSTPINDSLATVTPNPIVASSTQSPVVRRKRASAEQQMFEGPNYAFIGNLQDFRVYSALLTNKEIEEIHSGKFTHYTIHSDCRCPETFPKVLEDNGEGRYCVSNSYSTSSKRVNRVNYVSRSSFVNDGDSTSWISARLNSVNVSINLELLFEIVYVQAKLTFYGTSPDGNVSAAIQYKQNEAEPWRTWQLFAGNCMSMFGIAPSNETSPSSENCQQLDTGLKQHVLFFNLGKFYPNNSQRAIAKEVRLILNDDSDDARFAIEEIEVNGRCACSGQSRSCSLSSNMTSYKCDCLNHAAGDRCSKCIPGFYRQLSSAITQCRPCDCHPAGTSRVNNVSLCDGHTGQCRCRHQGESSLSGNDCSPYVLSVAPSYGPISGGTLLLVKGDYLAPVHVVVGDTACEVVERNDSSILCKSPGVSKQGVVNITLLYEGGDRNWTTLTATTFQYKEDPVIQEISPLETFLRGGLILDVVGRNLDSIYQPIMVTTMIYKQSRTEYKTVCFVTNSTHMKCPTADIKLPTDYVTRQKRDVTIKSELNNEDLKFYLGFLLDGVPTYRNLTTSLPQYAELRVFSDPVIHEFAGTNQVKVFNPDERPFLTIKGERMNYGCSADDYTVSVGLDGGCDVTDLSSNQVVCRPPKNQPQVDENNFGVGKTPHVKVRVGNIVVGVGFLEWYQPIPVTKTPVTETDAFKWGIGVACVLLALIIIVAIIVWCVVRRRKLKKMLRQENMYMKYLAERGDGGENAYVVPAMRRQIVENLDPDLKFRMQDSQIHPDRLLIPQNQSFLGKGHFGKVVKASLLDENFNDPVEVAVKTLKDEDLSDTVVSDFLEEGLMMKDFCHENVLSLYGVIIKDNIPMVVLPFMEHGDLRGYITNPDTSVTVGELLGFGQQVANGMEYLSNMKFVHRDLAARNCMVDKHICVKIADFGLSRDIYVKDYYSSSGVERPLPVKWMSIESLVDGVYTTKSDVWSFGVLLWELVTRGRSPYSDVDNFNMKTYLSAGHRLSKPEYSTSRAYALMVDCWSLNPEDRPTFTEIKRRLSSVLDRNASPENTRGGNVNDGYLVAGSD